MKPKCTHVYTKASLCIQTHCGFIVCMETPYKDNAEKSYVRHVEILVQ